MQATNVRTAEHPPQDRKAILIVDDDADVRDCIQVVLEVAGYDVSTASNGKEALERLASIQPRLILLDLMMPTMSGIEFLRVRSNDIALSRIPVVIASAWPNEAAKAEGAQGFVEKPISLDLLLRVVESYCASDAPEQRAPLVDGR